MKLLRVGLLLLAHLVGMAVGLWYFPPRPPDEYWYVLLVALALAQGSLLGIWSAVAGRSSPWRFAALAVLVILGTMLAQRQWSQDRAVWGYFLLAQMFGTAVPFFLLRFAGLEVAREQSQNAAADVYRAQFSIRSLLEWTAAVAILLGMVPLMPDEFRRPFTQATGETAFMIALFAVDGLTGVIALWAALGRRLLGLRLALVGATCVAIALTIYFGDRAFEPALLIGLPAFYAAWLIGSLVVFRSLGYRMAFRWSRTRAVEAQAVEATGETVSSQEAAGARRQETV